MSATTLSLPRYAVYSVTIEKAGELAQRATRVARSPKTKSNHDAEKVISTRGSGGNHHRSIKRAINAMRHKRRESSYSSSQPLSQVWAARVRVRDCACGDAAGGRGRDGARREDALSTVACAPLSLKITASSSVSGESHSESGRRRRHRIVHSRFHCG